MNVIPASALPRSEILPPQTGVNVVPREILNKIFSFSEAPDLLSCEKVNKRWRELASRPSLWTDLAKNLRISVVNDINPKSQVFDKIQSVSEVNHILLTYLQGHLQIERKLDPFEQRDEIRKSIRENIIRQKPALILATKTIFLKIKEDRLNSVYTKALQLLLDEGVRVKLDYVNPHQPLREETALDPSWESLIFQINYPHGFQELISRQPNGTISTIFISRALRTNNHQYVEILLNELSKENILSTSLLFLWGVTLQEKSLSEKVTRLLVSAFQKLDRSIISQTLDLCKKTREDAFRTRKQEIDRKKNMSDFEKEYQYRDLVKEQENFKHGLALITLHLLTTAPDHCAIF